MRPDLFKAVVAQVPFVDVLNTMLDASLPLTTSEYIEWGNPNEKPAYDYMKKYSPYDNVHKANYPAMLVKVSLNDSQVPYWEGCEAGRQDSRLQDRSQSAALESEHGRRARRRVGTLRRDSRDGVRLCVHAVADGDYELSTEPLAVASGHRISGPRRILAD